MPVANPELLSRLPQLVLLRAVITAQLQYHQPEHCQCKLSWFPPAVPAVVLEYLLIQGLYVCVVNNDRPNAGQAQVAPV
jgi:hypothetical protein